MKQISMFDDGNSIDGKYSKKIESPIYEPKNQKPLLIELYNKVKTSRLINEINHSNLPEEEKTFLRDAATRHTVFNYEKIADYYSHASPEMQNLMERSCLVIIDFEKAIQYGYVQLCDEIKSQFLTSYGE